MASSLYILLTLALVAYTTAAPAPAEDTEVTTVTPDNGVPIVAVVQVIDIIPEVITYEDSTTTDAAIEQNDHKVVKRSALRGDNPSNDLLAELDGLNYENGLSGLAGRRIKFLPTWVSASRVLDGLFLSPELLKNPVELRSSNDCMDFNAEHILREVVVYKIPLILSYESRKIESTEDIFLEDVYAYEGH